VTAPLGHGAAAVPGLAHLLEHVVAVVSSEACGSPPSIAATQSGTMSLSVLLPAGPDGVASFVGGLASCATDDEVIGRLAAMLRDEADDVDKENAQAAADPGRAPLVAAAVQADAGGAGSRRADALARLALGSRAELLALLDGDGAAEVVGAVRSLVLDGLFGPRGHWCVAVAVASDDAGAGGGGAAAGGGRRHRQSALRGGGGRLRESAEERRKAAETEAFTVLGAAITGFGPPGSFLQRASAGNGEGVRIERSVSRRRHGGGSHFASARLVPSGDAAGVPALPTTSPLLCAASSPGTGPASGLTARAFVPSPLAGTASGLAAERGRATAWLRTMSLAPSCVGLPLGPILRGNASARARAALPGGGRLEPDPHAPCTAMPVLAPGPGLLVLAPMRDTRPGEDAPPPAEVGAAAAAWLRGLASQEEHLWTEVLALLLARQGLAVGFSWDRAGPDREAMGAAARDTLAATGWLQSQPGLDDELAAFADMVAARAVASGGSPLPVSAAVSDTAATLELLGADLGEMHAWLGADDFFLGAQGADVAERAVHSAVGHLQIVLRDVADALERYGEE